MWRRKEEEEKKKREETTLNLSICRSLKSWHSKTMEIFEADLALWHGYVRTGTMGRMIWFSVNLSNTCFLAGGGGVFKLADSR